MLSLANEVHALGHNLPHKTPSVSFQVPWTNFSKAIKTCLLLNLNERFRYGLEWRSGERVVKNVIFVKFVVKCHDNPSRPIVSAYCYPTEFICSYLDIILSSLVESFPTYTWEIICPPSFQQLPIHWLQPPHIYSECPIFISHQEGLKTSWFFLQQRSNQFPNTKPLIFFLV